MMKLVYLGVLFFTSSLFGFTLIAPSSVQGFDTDTLEYKLNSENCTDTIINSIDKAMSVWNTVPSSRLTVKRNGSSSSSPSQALSGASPETPIIVCDSNFSSTTGEDADSILGVGGIYYSGGKIVYGYLVLNVQSGARANITRYSSGVITGIIVHEMGHSLGFGHADDRSAIMYYSASGADIQRLSADDADAMTYLYPRNEIFKDPIMGCGGPIIASTSSNLSGGGMLPLQIPQKNRYLFGLLLLPVGFYLILRRLSQKSQSKIN